MPRKNPNAKRWGGPGASHEDRTEPPPDPTVKDADDPDHFQPFSHVSGGGGERDLHHGHSARAKRDTEENRVQKRMD